MPKSDHLVSRRRDFQRALHAWYERHHRKLPWRDTPSLYKTVVSEFMLQQTQVATVLPYFARWQRELPDFTALAAADEATVTKLWEGLGYYSRARNLHRLAKAVAALPVPPLLPAEWQELPGIGPYTAAAITSISFGHPSACVDGNVVRILARLTAETRLFKDGTEAARHFTAMADALIVGGNPGTHNQAMMELGATVCLRQNPRCDLCPVAGFCQAHNGGDPGKLPRFKPRQIERKSVARIWCECRGRLLLKQIHPGARRLAGLYELPEDRDLKLAALAPASLLATKRRAITRFQIIESIHAVAPTPDIRRTAREDESFAWVPLGKIEQISLSGPHKRWIEELRYRPNRDPQGAQPSS